MTTKSPFVRPHILIYLTPKTIERRRNRYCQCHRHERDYAERVLVWLPCHILYVHALVARLHATYFQHHFCPRNHFWTLLGQPVRACISRHNAVAYTLVSYNDCTV